MTSPASFELRRDSSFELCNVPLLFTPLLGISTILPGPLPPPPDAVVPDDGRVTILPPSPSLSTPVLPVLLPPGALVPDDGTVESLPPSPSLSRPSLPAEAPPTPPCGMIGLPSLFSAKICFGCESGIIFGCTASFRALCA